jgi:hypothetical protein
MTEYRGISGTYSDFKLVKTRGVVQVIIEFPIEEGNQVLESLGGLPIAGKEEHVSLGLRSKLMDIAEGRATGPDRHANLSLVGKQRYAAADDMERARIRSIMLAKDPQFLAWAGGTTEAGARDFICERCRILSRSRIATEPWAYEAFLKLELEFQTAVGRAQLVAFQYEPSLEE